MKRIVALVVAWVVMSLVSCDDSAKVQRAAEERKELERIQGAIAKMAIKHNAVRDWHRRLPEEPYTMHIQDGLRGNDGRPIVLVGTVIDIERHDGRYTAHFETPLMVRPRIRFLLRMSAEHVKVITDHPHDPLMDAYAVVAAIRSVKKVKFVANAKPLSPEEAEIDVGPGDTFLISGHCLDVIFVGDALPLGQEVYDDSKTNSIDSDQTDQVAVTNEPKDTPPTSKSQTAGRDLFEEFGITLEPNDPLLVKKSQPEKPGFSDWYDIPAVPVSLPNGANIVPPQGPAGLGTLQITNGTNLDAVAKLILLTKSMPTNRIVYIQANSKVMIRQVGEGVYRLRFSLGTDWDRKAWRFLRDPTYSEFWDPVYFNQEETGSGVEYANYEITLHKVAGGQAKTSTIDQSAFEEGDRELRQRLALGNVTP